MSTNLTLSPKGLFTNYNALSEVDSGSLLVANNIVINERGIIKPRRGIQYYSSLFTNPTDRARQLLEYKGRIIRHVGSKLAFDNGSGLFTDFNGDYSDADADTRIKAIEYKGNYYFTSSDGVKKISVKSVSDLSSSSINNTGAPLSDGLSVKLVADINGILSANQWTAYKVTWGYKDANGLDIEGIPCYAVIAENPTVYQKFSVDCRIYIPSDVTTSYYFRLYRCETRTNTEALSDEFNLVFEGTPTAGEISNGYLDYNDNLSEDFRNAGLPLYSNPNSGTGADTLNYQPPMAVDVALYQNHIFYANTRLKHSKIITLQSLNNFVSGTSNFVVTNSTTSRTYTFQGAEEISTVTCQPKSFYTNGDYFLLNSANNKRRYFIYFKTTTPLTIPSNADTVGRIGVEVDIQADTTADQVAITLASVLNGLTDFTASSLLQVVTISNVENGIADATADSIYQPTGLVFATFQNGIGEDFSTNKVLLQDSLLNSPLLDLDVTARSLVDCINNDSLSFVNALYLGNGKILLQNKTIADTIFYTDSTDINIKKNWFPNLSATLNGSDSSKAINGLYFSKQDEPESVPLIQSILVGSSDEPILRIVPLRESLFIFKTDGLYRLSGYDKNSFSVTLFDSTAILKAPDSASVLRNQIYFYGTQGISRVSEGGSEKLSNPIDDKVIPLITTCSNLAKLTFAVSVETEQSYMLWTATKANDTTAQVGYRYNMYTDSWTEWRIAKTCAVLNSNEDKLYFGSGVANTLEVERKNFDRFDYTEREIAITLPALSIYGNIIKPSGASQIEAGDVIYQLQGVTKSQFNQIITMLQTDPSYPVNNFADYVLGNGESITNKITSLVNYLNTIDTDNFTDTHGNTSYQSTVSTDILVVQTAWFKIIDRINQSPSFFLSNYPKYNRTTPIEATVISRDISNNDIYLSLEYPFLEGNMVLYKSIDTDVEFVPQSGGDASSLKQFSSCQVMFQNRSIVTAQVGFSSDLNSDFEYVNFAPNSASTWGNSAWGTGSVWGGEGDKAPLRTYVPARKQRCRFIGLRFKHKGALETFSLYGLSLTYNSHSDRAYK